MIEGGWKPGRLAELLVERFERVLGPDVQVKSPERIRGRHTGQRREVDVTLRRRVGATDILVAVECRDRKGPQDVRWIEELSAKREDVGANAMVAVSTSGFTEAARRSADTHGILLRELMQIGADEVDRWFVRTQLSLPRLRLLGALVRTRDPQVPKLFVTAEEEETGLVFLIPPVDEPRPLRLLYQSSMEQVLAGATVHVPPGAKNYPVELQITPESDAAAVTTRDGTTYPLAEISVLFAFSMEALPHAGMEARQYADEDGVLAQTSTYVYPFPGGITTLSVTESPPEGEKYLFKHPKAEPPPDLAGKKRKRRK